MASMDRNLFVRPPLQISEDEIVGYVDPWIVSPGDTADVKVSSTKKKLRYQLVRLIQGLTFPGSPPVRREVIDCNVKGNCVGRFQAAHPGSYAEVSGWNRQHLLQTALGVHIFLYAQPWMLSAQYGQALMSTLDVDTKSGVAILIDQSADIQIWVGTGKAVEVVTLTSPSLRERRWFQIDIKIEKCEVNVSVVHLPFELESTPTPQHLRKNLRSEANLYSNTSLLFAATYAGSPTSRSDRPTHFYNGRIDSPSIRTLGDRPFCVAAYDFSIGITTDEIFDTSGSGLTGKLINAPTRAVKGYNHDFTSGADWKAAKYGFGAVHFHDDDLDDAAWETDFKITVPDSLRSGAYAVEIRDEESSLQDSIVFFVRPKAIRPQTKVAFVFSTFTFLAYGNEHMYDETKSTHISFPEGVQLLHSENYERMVRRKDLGLAIYDLHNDGHGVVYSTSKRPLLNMRPDYVHWAFQRPREFSADLLMVGFLERLLGDGYDVLTDHDLHLHGVSALSGYDIVISGSHPEYPSAQSLDAYKGFAQLGGSIIYAGGNGFYWKSVTDPARPHRMEVRRADVGARTHENPHGERYHSLNGDLGGLWRSIGRPPNVLFGIGSCASGKGPGRPFFPTQEALNNPDLAWLWKGLDSSSKIALGKYGLAGGASGDELDRLDFEIGTPKNAILIARSERHDDHFMLFNEELIFPMIGTLGSTSTLVRSDIVYFDTAAGGSVFSVGSINWNNSMAWDNYDNDIAHVTANVIREFLQRAEQKRTLST